MNYRPEIDGLRAIAVIAVVLHHAGIEWIPGGYVGVDVFFVISGFLITSIIWRECSEDRFSLIRFWERRARRIIPAVTFLVLVTAIAGAFLLLPRDFKMLGQSMVAQSAMLSNFYFWHMSGYFDQASELKPLLHTWSLAVEEQFYLAFPLVLFALRKCSKRVVLAALGLGFISSIFLSVWQTARYPDAAFYLLPARMWELILGAVLAIGLPGGRLPVGVKMRAVVSCIGILMIVVTLCTFTSDTHFPSYTALLPCLGAALVIAGASGHVVGKLLSTKVMVGIGLISYSWYLWHWPIFAYLNYWLHEPGVVRWGAVVVSLVIAWMSWKWVEQPFRKKVEPLHVSEYS